MGNFGAFLWLIRISPPLKFGIASPRNEGAAIRLRLARDDNSQAEQTGKKSMVMLSATAR